MMFEELPKVEPAHPEMLAHPVFREVKGHNAAPSNSADGIYEAQPQNPELERRFTYHAPKGNQQVRYERRRNFAKSLAYVIEQACPDSREKSLALTNLEQAVMWANASIARNE